VTSTAVGCLIEPCRTPELLATFAREAGAGRERSIILVLDNAGWHGPTDEIEQPFSAADLL
jgi:hypothetical protein